MIGQNISHYKILEKLGEVPKWLTSVLQRVIAILRIQPLLSAELVEASKDGGSCLWKCI